MIEHLSKGGVAVRSRDCRARASGRPLLLYLHGLGESGACFEGVLSHPVLEELSQIAIDLPGYGKSPWLPRPSSLEEQARFVSSFIGRQIARPLVLVGHSMGGVIGQLLCELPGPHRRYLRGFVNVEGNLSMGDCTTSAEAVSSSRESFLGAGFGELLHRTFERGADDSAQRGYYASMRLCDPRQFYLNSKELVALSKEERLAERLASLSLPYLYVAGHPGGAAERSLQLLRTFRAPYVEIEPSGHWPFIDQPAEFVQELHSFLDPLG